MDKISAEVRSRNMASIRSKNSKPELAVRSGLHQLGFRFRLHVRNLPGSPDIVLPRHRTVILVHGCFWHRHQGCKMAYTPKSRLDFWQEKFNRNMARDARAERQLKELGWQVMVVWECETLDMVKVLDRLSQSMRVLGTEAKAETSRDARICLR